MKTAEYIFHSQKHKEFYEYYLSRCSSRDSHHKALLYCLGMDIITRTHIHEIYDFTAGCVSTESLDAPWQTGSSMKVTRLAFNLYTDGMPGIYDHADLMEQLEECKGYSVSDIMCCEYLRYFLEAVKVRYAEYL